MTTLLRVENLGVEIAGAPVVERLDFEVGAGETFALLGESGCGKSMTALALMRLLPPGGRITAGAVRLDGLDLRTLPETAMRRVRGGGMGMIFQEPMLALNPVMKVGTQIGEVLALHRGLSGHAKTEAAIALLAAVGIPDPVRRLESYAFELSGGLRQRVMIAMALAGEPRLLIADEPTTALDVTIQAQVLDVLRGLRSQRGMGMLLITHDLGVVAENADRVGVMYAGELIETGSRADFFARPQHPYSQMLFDTLPGQRRARLVTIPGQVPRPGAMPPGCRFAPRCPHARARCTEERPTWQQVGTQQVRCHFAGRIERGQAPAEVETAADRGAQASPHAPVVSVESLAVHFPIRRGLLRRVVGQVRAVDGVNFELVPGRTLALVGESGCGKTTVGKALLRLVEPTGGTVHLDASPLDPRRLRRLREAVQMVFQDPYSSLNPRMRVADILIEGMDALGVGAPAERAGAVARLLAEVGLPEDAGGRFPHAFSGGQRQRIAIARALAVNPRVIVLDEPTSALDVSVQAQILNLLADLQARLGLAYLFITHNLAVVEHLAHEVAVMYLGRIIEAGPARAVLEAPRHPYTQALVAAVPRLAGRVETAALQGDQPSPLAPPSGCHFHPRCPHANARCREQYPEATAVGTGHTVRCHWVASGSV